MCFYIRFITTESKLFISIMAGTKMETLAGNLRTIVESPRIIRVHPNTPAMVGQGCSVYSIGEGKWIFICQVNCIDDFQMATQQFIWGAKNTYLSLFL